METVGFRHYAQQPPNRLALLLQDIARYRVTTTCLIAQQAKARKVALSSS